MLCSVPFTKPPLEESTRLILTINKTFHTRRTTITTGRVPAETRTTVRVVHRRQVFSMWPRLFSLRELDDADVNCVIEVVTDVRACGWFSRLN